MRHSKVGMQLEAHKNYISQCEQKQSVITMSSLMGNMKFIQAMIRSEPIDDFTKLLKDIIIVSMPAAEKLVIIPNSKMFLLLMC